MAATIYWFRKALRLHDNPSLLSAIAQADVLAPVFVLDPWFAQSGQCGALRYNFLLQSLRALNRDLEARGSRLFVLQGTPDQVFTELLQSGAYSTLCWERDTEPYARDRDARIEQLARDAQVAVLTEYGHTLYDLDARHAGGVVPTTYAAFQKLVAKWGEPPRPRPAPDRMPRVPAALDKQVAAADGVLQAAMRALEPGQQLLVEGSEAAALTRMQAYCASSARVASFAKPDTDPTQAWYNVGAPVPGGATTVLSPYLHLGLLSPRAFYWALVDATRGAKKVTQPPVSLVGQLLWREFFHYVGRWTPNFDRMQGNALCRQIPWEPNAELLRAWRDGRTGYPWIDAIMTQLRLEGWIHHLARHCVACFLTRGDCWVPWEAGAAVFQELLLDADWSLNSANWMWLSCSAFYHQYWKCYSPVAFAKQYAGAEAYIKKYVPALQRYPSKYIFAPHTAPLDMQRAWGCVIGRDYPAPIVDHDVVCARNKERLKAAFDKAK